MNNDITTTAGGLPSRLDDHVMEFIRAAKSDNTIRAYESDWEHFLGWCAEDGGRALPASPEVVAQYVSDLSETHRPSTLQRRLAAISVAHQAAGYESPTHAPLVRTVLQGIRRSKGTARRQAAPLLVEHVRQVLLTLGDSPIDTRNKAILLVGLAGAFRRSELVGIDIEDLEFRERGVVVSLKHSKTNQDGGVERKGIGRGSFEGTCPVTALKKWLDVSEIIEGPVFRPFSRKGELLDQRLSDRAISRLVKNVAKRIGLDPATYSGHSLRAGFITQLYRHGVAEPDIMQLSGHRSRNVLAEYRREGELFLGDLTRRAGL